MYSIHDQAERTRRRLERCSYRARFTARQGPHGIEQVCEAGETLADGSAGYQLEGLKVSKCGSAAGAPVDSATFNYEKVTVGTWDPQKRTVVTGEAKPR